MRIISGKARGTNLYTMDGTETRPTLDRVKESLFNIINNRIFNSTVLDLFSGSGAIGLEFASRGAEKVFLCDNSKKAIEIIENNSRKTHLQEKVHIYNCDFIQMLKKLEKEKIDIIYLDPPYKTDYIAKAIEIIIQFNILKEDGIIIAETDEIERISNQIKDLNLEIIDKRKYGRAYLIFISL